MFPESDSHRSYVGSSLKSNSDFGALGEDAQVRIREDESKFEITLDVQQYKPDELKVCKLPPFPNSTLSTVETRDGLSVFL